MEILSVKNLNVELGGRSIIEDLSFEVEKGEYLTIIGPNGAGKTTLFRALIGVVPYKGEINWAEGSKIGYVPQKLDLERNLPISLKDFLESKSAAFAKPDLPEYLKLVRLPSQLLSRSLGDLSGGEFQRALVAFALMGETNVLLFDEPTAGIDKPSEEEIYETLHRLQDEKQITIITISHDLSFVSRFADKVLCLNKRGVCYGPPKEVLEAENLAKLYGPKHYKFFHHLHDIH